MELASAPSAGDADAIAACFTEDGEVKDEGETRQGRPAISEWWKGPATAFQYTVEVQDNKVILKGTVRSWAERQEAERVAWSAPGVIAVENRITVIP